MKRQAILFDLDGTLLPMDLEEFTQTHIVTDSLITHGLDLNDFSHSTFAELSKYL